MMEMKEREREGGESGGDRLTLKRGQEDTNDIKIMGVEKEEEEYRVKEVGKPEGR